MPKPELKISIAPEDSPHRRYNPLNGEWIIVSPQRSKRPWQSAAAKEAPMLEAYDAKCFLCPGNHRSSLDNKKIQNPDYEDIFVFENDFPCLVDGDDLTKRESSHKKELNHSLNKNLFIQQDIRGTCRVICYSKHHNVNLGDMPDSSIVNVIDEWINQLNELGAKYAYVQIFESKGELVGCSSQHPHGQIWALDFIPHLVKQENTRQRDYYKQYKSNLLLDYLSAEESLGERIVIADDHWVVLVPYWAYWPYETMLLPRRNIGSLQDINQDEKNTLAPMLKKLVTIYDKLFNISFPYRMGWHSSCKQQQDKTDGKDNACLLHCHFYPPLLDRVRQKYTAGFEVSAELQRDITPEQAAQKLREAV